jgi:tRNA nucleotidyltransferase (CCA-adding enzyme)
LLVVTASAFETAQGQEPLDILRVAALAAHEPESAPAPEILARLEQRVAAGALDALEPAAVWPALAHGLMGEHPSRMLELLRRCGGLARLAPELDALFGVPQSADDPPEVDVGEHQWRLVDETARIGAPLAVRWAALLHKLGKAGSPREFWPGHYGHEARGEPLAEAVCERFQVPGDCRDLALLAVRECDRVHRAVDMRATAIATLLERVEALRYPERFEQLLAVCACDYRAYPGRALATYPKTELLRLAFKAFAGLGPPGPDFQARMFETRAQAVAEALRSERWTDA